MNAHRTAGRRGRGASRPARRRAASCRALLAAGALLAAACTSGPAFERPAPPAASGWLHEGLPARMPADVAAPDAGAPDPIHDGTGPGRRGLAGDAAPVPGQHFDAGAALAPQWWRSFQSPALDALVAQALRANPDLAAARAALLAAQEGALAQQAAQLPSVQLGYGASRQKNPLGTLAPSLQSGDAVYSLHTAQVSVGYVPDVFGGLRRQSEAALAQAEVQHWQAAAASVTLAANVVLTAVNAAGLRAQIEATQALIRLQERQRQLLQRQRELGAGTDAELAAQEAAMAQLQATLPGLRRQLEQAQHRQVVLAGKTPAEDAGQEFSLDALVLPEGLPLLLPAQVVDQRPDVRAAEAQLHAATAGLGAAISNRLPQFSLSASYGATATAPGGLLAPANTFWTLAASLAQTVFDGDALRHREKAADAQVRQAAAQYRSTVLSAFQEVADVLVALREDAAAAQASAQAEQAAGRALELARQQERLGSSGALPVLQAEQALAQARLATLQARTSRLADTVALFQALGGGWNGAAEALNWPAAP